MKEINELEYKSGVSEILAYAKELAKKCNYKVEDTKVNNIDECYEFRSNEKGHFTISLSFRILPIIKGFEHQPVVIKVIAPSLGHMCFSCENQAMYRITSMENYIDMSKKALDYTFDKWSSKMLELEKIDF